MVWHERKSQLNEFILSHHAASGLERWSSGPALLVTHLTWFPAAADADAEPDQKTRIYLLSATTSDRMGFNIGMRCVFSDGQVQLQHRSALSFLQFMFLIYFKVICCVYDPGRLLLLCSLEASEHLNAPLRASVSGKRQRVGPLNKCRHQTWRRASSLMEGL